MIAPKFKHDCDICRFVGRLDGCDCYIHDSNHDNQLVMTVKRTSDIPEDYVSWSDLRDENKRRNDDLGAANASFNTIIRMGIA